jgi:uncharacterized DUF497 family protein
MASVIEGDFEWDAGKARANIKKHRVTFEEATTVFDDPHAIEAPDLYEASRFILIGMSAQSRVLFVVHAVRSERIRIISARRASPVQRRKYEENQ